jgi:hypothetical protein
VNQILDDHVAGKRKALADIAKQAEADELERVVALHGGGDEE